MVEFDENDEEKGLLRQQSSSGRQSSSNSNNSRQLSIQSDVSESEYQDYVSSEITPLVGGDSVAETVPPPTSYNGVDQMRNLQRIPSDTSLQSINTVTALPGMVIRCHSINIAVSGIHQGSCIIRPSTTKVALKAVQTEMRAARKRQQSNNTPLSGSSNTQQQLIENSTTSASPSFGMKESYWIDIETPQRSTDELYDFLKQLRLPPFFLAVLSEPSNWTSEFLALKQVSLAIFQILPADAASDEIAHVALLSMPRLLVTFSTFTRPNGTGGLYELVSQYMKEKERVPEPSSSGLVLAWLQFHVRRTSRAIRELRLATVEMDQRMDEDVVNFDFQQLVDAKNCLLRVLAVAEEQHETVEALAVAEQSTEGVNFANCKGALSMLRANSSSNERLSSRVDKHLNELRERVMSHREDILNQRLALLTILSAIFMPLTLLTGIWGMNFESMPELQYEGAYGKALFGMFSLSLCLVYSFYRAGWSTH